MGDGVRMTHLGHILDVGAQLLELKVEGLRFKFKGLGLRIQSLEFEIQGLGFRV